MKLVKINNKEAINPSFVQSVRESVAGIDEIIVYVTVGGPRYTSSFVSAYSLEKTIQLINGEELYTTDH